jgi:hypothetical protein
MNNSHDQLVNESAIAWSDTLFWNMIFPSANRIGRIGVIVKLSQGTKTDNARFDEEKNLPLIPGGFV